jgi:hypothetical protein
MRRGGAFERVYDRPGQRLMDVQLLDVALVLCSVLPSLGQF